MNFNNIKNLKIHKFKLNNALNKYLRPSKPKLQKVVKTLKIKLYEKFNELTDYYNLSIINNMLKIILKKIIQTPHGIFSIHKRIMNRLIKSSLIPGQCKKARQSPPTSPGFICDPTSTSIPPIKCASDVNSTDPTKCLKCDFETLNKELLCNRCQKKQSYTYKL